MNENKEEILSKTFANIKRDKKKTVLEVIGSFILGTVSSLGVDYIRNGWPTNENINGFILRGFKFGFLVSICVVLYAIYKEKKSYDEWIDIQDKKIRILKEERGIESSNDVTNEDKEENIESFMCEFVENTRCVDAIQIHKYDIIAEGKNIIIPIELKRQYLKKGKRHYLNAITNYYKVDKDIFREFYLIKEDIQNVSIPRKEVLHHIETLMEDISANINAEHIRIYEILISMAAKINRYIGEDDKTDGNGQKEIAAAVLPEDISNNIKRTGILGGVLYRDGYPYEYTKGNELKENRKYYSLCSDIEEDEVIVTIIFDTSLSFGNDLTELIGDIMESYNSIRKKYGVGDGYEK